MSEVERKKVAQELAKKRLDERNAILRTVKNALPEYETKKKLYPLFKIKDKSVADEDREYVIRKRIEKHFFTKSTYFKINTGEELLKCLKTELSSIQSKSELNPDKGFVKIIDDKSIHEFFQSCIDDGQIMRIQSRTGEKINKNERTRIRKTVNFYRGIRDATKFHVFYEHPDQTFKTGKNDRFVWLVDNRWTGEDFAAWIFFICSTLYMIKVFLPDFFFSILNWVGWLLFYVPIGIILGMTLSSWGSKCMTVLMYAVSRGKIRKIYLPNMYKGATFRSLFSPLSVSYEKEPEMTHYEQVMTLLGRYESYGGNEENTEKNKKKD